MSVKIADIFYKAFQKRDFKTMQSLYAPEATFSDAAFQNLNGKEVRAMWQMLLTNAKDGFALDYHVLQETDTKATIMWVATYTFSKTNRKVVNKIKAEWVIENGLIKNHIDTFNFHTWAKQALGTIGLLLGWTSFLKNKVRTEARKNLSNFIQKNNL